MQAKLLRVLQEGEVRAVGDSKTRKVDVRVIAATNQSLEAGQGRVASARTSTSASTCCASNCRRCATAGSDILVLARRFLAEAAAKAGRLLTLSPAAEAALLAAKWPGNVRQLQNEMLRLSALADGPVVEARELSADVKPA
jgi:DNA-binding NtrC family response regulator